MTTVKDVSGVLCWCVLCLDGGWQVLRKYLENSEEMLRHVSSEVLGRSEDARPAISVHRRPTSAQAESSETTCLSTSPTVTEAEACDKHVV